MTPDQIVEFAQEAVYVLLITSMPLMLVGMAVGLVIAIFQSLTQIQEMTMTFVPKILVVFLSLLFLLPFMLDHLMHFMAEVATLIRNVERF